MKAFFILYNQINKNYYDTSLSDRFFYIHHNWKINFNWEELKLNLRSKILDYAMGYNFIKELKEDWFNADFFINKSYFDWIYNYCNEYKVNEVFIIKPVENFVFENFKKIQQKLIEKNIKLTFLEDNRSFFISNKLFLKNFEKPPVMETFYRFMRKKFNILIENNKPTWWKWNYDSENRWFDKNHKKSFNFKLEENIWVKKAKEFYNTDINLNYPTNRDESIKLLNYFVKNHLDNFWKLEDAMYENDDFVNHSLLSTAINFWLLWPLEVVKIIEKEETSINNKEWFIRQILWWREYMYHFFCFYKDSIYKNNFLNHNNNLPEYFWWKNLSKCKANCLKTSISRVLENNYGHHIERLMVIWNFSLLNNISPLEINKWFFENYTDAFEWVVTPNVMWMSQFSDWWKLATKPYVSSWNYINKMSDFCKNCEYNIKEKYDDNSCPFNYLYWNFVDENKEIFKKTRQPFIVKNLEKIDIEKIKVLKEKFINK